MSTRMNRNDVRFTTGIRHPLRRCLVPFAKLLIPAFASSAAIAGAPSIELVKDIDDARRRRLRARTIPRVRRQGLFHGDAAGERHRTPC